MIQALIALALAAPGRIQGSGVFPAAPVAFRYYADSSGALIPDDANTVAHVYWNGTALVDTKGNAWTMNGTVPQVSAGPLYPHGFSQPAKAGAGPFSTANYYTSTLSALAFPTGTAWTVCVVFDVTNLAFATAQDIWGDFPNSSASGWLVQFQSTGIYLQTGDGSANHTTGALAIGQNGPSVFCASFDGASTAYSMANASGTVTTSTGFGYAALAPAAHPVYIGTEGTLAWPAGGTTIYELWAATGDYHMQFTRIEQGVFGMLASGGVPVTNSRTSTATDMIAGTLYTWPANVSRIDPNGLLSEPATTNLALYSQQFDNAAWVKTNVTVTANTTIAPDTTVTADTLADSAVGGNVSSTAVTASASAYSVSVYLQTASGTQAAQLDLYDATSAAVLCSVTPAVTSAVTLFKCSTTANATAGDALHLRIWPGGTAASGTVIAWGSQLEALPAVTSYTGEVLGTAVTRSADGLTLVPTTSAYNNGCEGLTIAPAGWSGGLLWGGTSNFSDPGLMLYTNNGQPVFIQFDGANSNEGTWAPVAGVAHRLVSAFGQGVRNCLVMDRSPACGPAASGKSYYELGGITPDQPLWLSNVVIGTTSDWHACQ